MNSDWNHPVIGVCILTFVVSVILLTLCSFLSDGNYWFFLCLLPSLVLAALGGLIAALWMRLSRLESQVCFLRDQLHRLESEPALISKCKD